MLPLLDPSLDPLFWDNLRSSTPSAWHGHVPFAHWLVATLRPRQIVELGTYAGVSYAAFCQAVERASPGTRCAAVDSWLGDVHAGFFPEQLYTELKAFHDPRFGSFSTLLRTTFDDALSAFADGSVDLLHIDGMHSYDAVSHDFHSWKPKLAAHAVVLFHDTAIRHSNFGVWQLWEELRHTGAGSIEFQHCAGLGVLLMGPVAPALHALAQAPIDQVRHRFATLGLLHELEAERSVRAPVLPDEPVSAIKPKLDRFLKPGTLHIAERFVAPAGMTALRLPHDAVSRNPAGCTVWLVSHDGQDWRMGRIPAPTKADDVILGFAAFAAPHPHHVHVFVTDPCRDASGLPKALADHLSNRRPPIALQTMRLPLPALPAHALVQLPEPSGA